MLNCFEIFVLDRLNARENSTYTIGPRKCMPKGNFTCIRLELKKRRMRKKNAHNSDFIINSSQDIAHKYSQTVVCWYRNMFSYEMAYVRSERLEN